MAIHLELEPKNIDMTAFETHHLNRMNMPDEIIMCHRIFQFTHIFYKDDDAKDYHSYLWAEVLDAEGSEAFKETVNIINKNLAQRLIKGNFRFGRKNRNQNGPCQFSKEFGLNRTLLTKMNFLKLTI